MCGARQSSDFFCLHHIAPKQEIICTWWRVTTGVIVSLHTYKCRLWIDDSHGYLQPGPGMYSVHESFALERCYPDIKD